MSLIWNNVSFTTDQPLLNKLVSACCCGCCFNAQTAKKKILVSLSGEIKCGELIALMGPSGAGKSTLLNCITQGRKFAGFDGEIKIQGLRENEAVRASFINQDEKEHLLLALTVKQALEYSSRLKNPPDTLKQIHEVIVSDLISDLELEGTENTSISKCSGGQRKRLAICLELTAMAKPHFLFLDEPTSGLDSYVGLKVIQLLSNLAKKHSMAIVATIHQPSYKLFSLFSRAYIISGAGDFIYNGSPQDLKSFAGSCGYESGLRENNENPADVAIELASAINRNNLATPSDYKARYLVIPVDQQSNDHAQILQFTDDQNVQVFEGNDETENLQICVRMVKKIKENENYKQINQTNIDGKAENIRDVQDDGLCKNGSNFTLFSLWVLIQRSGHTSIWKQKKFILIRLLLHAIVAGVLAVLYSRNIGTDDGCISIINPYMLAYDPKNCSCTQSQGEMKPDSVTSQNVKFQFFSLLFLMFAALMPTVLTFPAEIKLFLNEFRNGWYSSTSYYISKTITEIPLQLLFAFFYTYFLYWYSQQPEMEDWYDGFAWTMSGRYAQFLLITILCCFIAQGLGFLIGIVCVRSFNISIIVSSSTLLFLFLFSGFFVKRVNMSADSSWITYFSFIRFGFESLLLTIYGDGRCKSTQVASVLQMFALKDEELSFNIWMLVTHLIVIRLVAFLVLVYMADTSILTRFPMLNSALDKCLVVCSKLHPAMKKLRKFVVRIVQCCLLFVIVQMAVGIVLFVVYETKNQENLESFNASDYDNVLQRGNDTN